MQGRARLALVYMLDIYRKPLYARPGQVLRDFQRSVFLGVRRVCYLRWCLAAFSNRCVATSRRLALLRGVVWISTYALYDPVGTVSKLSLYNVCVLEVQHSFLLYLAIASYHLTLYPVCGVSTTHIYLVLFYSLSVLTLL